MTSNKTVQLFNGEPVIAVRFYPAERIYRWATKKSGMMQHSLRSEVKRYMKQYGYKFIIEDAKKDFRLV